MTDIFSEPEADPSPPDAVGQPQDQPSFVTETVSPAKQAERKTAAVKAGMIVVGLLMGTVAWHVVSDIFAPESMTGSVTAVTAMMAPRVAGQVDRVLVSDNQIVMAGDALFTLDPAPFDLAVRQAEASLAQVTQNVEASVISLTTSVAKVDQAEAALMNVTATTDRSLRLFGRGFVAQAQVDAAKSELLTATAALQSANAELQSAELASGGDKVINPQVDAATAELDQARMNRSYTTVTAPHAGVITNLKLAEGQFVNAGTPALTFIQNQSRWVVVDLRENQLTRVQVGDDADILFDALPGRVIAARVRSIAWGIDTGRTAANGLPQNQSLVRWFEPARTIPVHLELVNDADWPKNVRIGSQAGAVVFSEGRGNPVAALASLLQSVSSVLSFVY